MTSPERAGQAMNRADTARKTRAALINRLHRERVQGSEHTPAELEARLRQLKADYLAREAQRRAA